MGVCGILDTQPKDPELPALKSEDIQYIDKLLQDVDESTLTKAEKNEREIMAYSLKIKNGTPPQRKSGLRTNTENAPRGSTPIGTPAINTLSDSSVKQLSVDKIHLQRAATFTIESNLKVLLVLNLLD